MSYNRRDFVDDDSELKEILELSRRTYEEEKWKERNPKYSRSFGVESKTSRNLEIQPERRSLTDDDLINLKSADLITEQKVQSIKALINNPSYYFRNVSQYNQHLHNGGASSVNFPSTPENNYFATKFRESASFSSTLCSKTGSEPNFYNTPSRSFSSKEFLNANGSLKETNRMSSGSSSIVLRKPTPNPSKTNNLPIPYLSHTLNNNLINVGTPSVAVHVSTKEDLMKEFDPLMARWDDLEDRKSTESIRKSSDEIKSEKFFPSQTKFEKKLSLDSAKMRPLTIVNARQQILTKAFEPYQRSTIAAGSRLGGFNMDNLKIIDRISDPESQLNEIRSYLLEDLNVVDDVWFRLIISPRVQYPVPSVSSVKLVVRCELLSSPVVFTCDVCSSIELTAAQVLFEAKNCKVSLDEFALKVFALDEYFLPSTQLSDYAYVHNCVKLGKDIELQLVKLPSFQSTFSSSFDSITEVNRFSVKNKDVSIALDTFKSELCKLEDAAINGNAAHSSGVIQSVKMICIFLHNIQPLDLIQNLNQLKGLCDTLVEDRKMKFFMQKQRGISNNDIVFRPTTQLLQDLKRSISSIAYSMHRFLTTYSDSSFVSFTLPPLDESTSIVDEKISKEIVNIEENLLVRIESVHNFPSEWLATFEKFYLACYVFHGLSEISEMVKTEPATDQSCSFKCLKFDYWMTFDKTLLCVLPRESRICFVLFGTRVEIESESSNSASASSSHSAPSPVRSIVEVQLCWGTLPLFDYRSRLNQSSYFISMSRSPNIEPWGPPGLLADCNKDWPVLAVTLPSFSFNYRFPDVLTAGERVSMSFECLDVEQQQYLEDIIEHGSILDADEKDLLWEKRHYLIKKPEALPLVLKSAVGWDWACLSNIYQLLKVWTPLNTAQAVGLLLPEFPDTEIRTKACSWLASSGADQLHEFLPQLTEALSFEIYENSPLTKLLLQVASKNRRFAYGLFWQLEERRTRNLFGCRCTMLQSFLISILGQDFHSAIELQQKLVVQMDTVAVEIKQCKDGERTRLLSSHVTEMDGKLLQKHVHLPLYPSVLAVGVEWTKCKYFSSLTLPVKISFRTLNSNYDVLHKVGDDLRQDALVLQMIRLMDDLWLREGLDLRMITYRCLSTGYKKGMIDMVHDCKTLREIHVEEGGVTGALKDDLIRKWLQKQNPSELDYLSALENFRRSSAGWCVGTFILGIGDRHNDNIMITSRGHVFHIDFGKYLGDAQMFGNFKRDRTPFILTQDMVTVINGGTSQGTYFQNFVDHCCKSFNIVRNNYALFINLMKLMVCSNIPGLNMDAVKYICSNLWLDFTDNEASVRFTRMIEETMRNKFPTFNFILHTTVALWKSPSNPTFVEEKHLLSFSPKIFTSADDGRLQSVIVLDCEKWRDNDKKVYMYKIHVERINVKVPSYIYRSYKEFGEFSDCLYNRFPLAKIVILPHGRSIGRTNVRNIAERRRQEIDIFLQSLFRMTEEIAHSEIVYTFFHPLLRDEQRIERTQEPKIVSQPRSSHEIKGELKISVDYIKDHLEVMVHHARDLAFANVNIPPDTYVKCYLRPDPERRSKRKTRIIGKSVNPTYNETFVYSWPRESLVDKVLELTVWRKGTLKENAFLGCVRISLDQIFLDYPASKVFEKWFRLMNKLS